MSEMDKNKCGVLFDLDGVLLDSEGQYSIFWKLMDESYPTGIDNFAAYIKGFHLKRIMSYFDSEEVRRVVLEKLMEFERNMRFEFFPGALEFVKQLHDAGIPMAIVTSSDRTKMQSLYSQHPEFPSLFDHIITGDMVTKAKPDPQCFLTAARLLDRNISDCIVFEDSRNGLIAARDSGARVIGVSTTMSVEDVMPLCDMTIQAVSQLNISQMLDCPKK